MGVAGWVWSTHATVSASQEQTLSGRGARVYTIHDNVACISVLQRIRGVTIMRYINLHFTYLLTYLLSYLPK